MDLSIVSPANCEKTFLLKPTRTIFQCFMNPATCTVSWIGTETAEVIFLNDVYWSPGIL